MEKTAALLLSRQPMRPAGKTAWVSKTKEAVQWIGYHNFTLCTSVGMNTWEILIAMADHHKVKQKIFIPSKNMKDFHDQCQVAAYQFNLRGDMEEFIPVLPDNMSVSKKDLMQKRDRMICQEADILIPLSVRHDGLIARLISEQSQMNKIIEKRFAVDYEKRTLPLSYRIENKFLTQRIKDIKEGQYIIHWTRGANSAWPTERLIEYYSAIINSSTYPRSAMDTLCNIIETKRIAASAKNMPHSSATVSFTSLSPREIAPLVRWRARFLQMSFEPYGIGIEREYALKCSISPVHYYQKKSDCHVKGDDMWLTQSSGKKSDWRAEKEFRCRGDFDLSPITDEKLICFCFTEDEAVEIEKHYGIGALSFI